MSYACSLCSKKNIEIKSILFGIPDKFIEHASREEMLHEAGLTADQILSKICALEQID